MSNPDDLPRLGLGDLRPGDVVLLENSKLISGEPEPIGETASSIDGSPYSHAVVMLGDKDWCLSANQKTGGFPSGVNRLPLRSFNHRSKPPDNQHSRFGRPMLVLRYDEPARAARAVEEGLHWVDTDTKNPSDFGWDQIVISGFAGIARRLEPGSRGRGLLSEAAHKTSSLLLPTPPRPESDPLWNSDPRDRWDCCQFIDHLFSYKGGPTIGTIESDPADDKPVGDVLKEVWGFWRDSLRSKVCGDVGQALSPDDESELAELVEAVGAEITEEGLFGDLRDLLRMLFCIRRRAAAGGSAAPNTESIDDRIVVGEPVYAPFNSPRLLAQSTPNLRKVGIIPADTL